MRERIGAVIVPDRLDTLVPTVTEIVGTASEWRTRLAQVRSESVYNVGRSGHAAAAVIAAKAEAFVTARGLR